MSRVRYRAAVIRIKLRLYRRLTACSIAATLVKIAVKLSPTFMTELRNQWVNAELRREWEIAE